MNHYRHAILPAALVVTVFASRSFALTDLKRGDEAPPIALPTADGGELQTARLRDRTLVLLFAETSHRRTRLACRDITTALGARPLADEPVEWIVILAKGGRAEAMIEDIGGAGRPPIIAHDVERAAFGAYEVKVVPTVVIVDRDGKVVHTMVGYSNRFADIVFDALLFATGKLSLQRFEEALDPATVTSADERRNRARRSVLFAHQLARRGLLPMAESRYLKAIELDPDSLPARLGLGDLLLQQQRYAEAEGRFREVLAVDPDLPEGRLGLAFVFALGEPPRTDEAWKLVDELLRRQPDWPRANFLAGVIHEQRGETNEAAARYKQAAEQLLRQLGPQPPAAYSSSSQ